VGAAGLGMTGGWIEAMSAAAELLPAARVVSEWDVVTCLLGARAGNPGIVLIAGTGSVAFGINTVGERADAGGWGYFLGDQGSAYDVGHAALRAVVKAHDGRGPATELSATVLKRLSVLDLRELHRRYYSGGIERADIAGLAACVGVAAESGDRVAQDLLADAAQELAQMVSAVAHRLWLPGDAVAVSPVGGLFRAGDMLLTPLRVALSTIAPETTFVKPLFAPVIGGVLLALRTLAVPVTEPLLAELTKSAEELSNLKF
jgi:glucosamine kinase